MMKTIQITIFTIVVMVLAFNVTPSYATEESNKAVKKELDRWFCPGGRKPHILEGKCEGRREAQQMDKLHDLDQDGNERDIADSGNEGSTSAAEAAGQ